MPLSTDDIYGSDYDFNEAFDELQDYLREKHPDLSATFNQEQAGFLAAILNDIHYLHTVGEKATAADVTRVLYQEIRNEGERKNAAMDIVSTLHHVPTEANTTKLVRKEEEDKALSIAHETARNKHAINFFKISIGSFFTINISLITTIGIMPSILEIVLTNLAFPAIFGLLAGAVYTTTLEDTFLKKHGGKDSKAYKEAIESANISRKAEKRYEEQAIPFREDFEAKAKRFFEPNFGKRNQPPIRFTPL